MNIIQWQINRKMKMERKHIYRIAILSAIFIAALPSFAQTSDGWDTRFWPASETDVRIKDGSDWVFQADVVTSNLLDSLQERYEAAMLQPYSEYNGISEMMPRRPDNALSAIKYTLRGIVDYYLNHTLFPIPEDPTSAIITNLTYWNSTSILIRCNLPTNFFDYTPPRNLSGHIGTGSAHWTNSARYGWDATKSVITNLIYTYQNSGILKTKEQAIKNTGTSDPDPSLSIPEIYNNCDFYDEVTDFLYQDMTYSSNYLSAAYWYDDFWGNLFSINLQQYFYSEYSKNIIAGRPAFHVAPTTNSVLIDRQHVAFSFQKIVGSIYYQDIGSGREPSWIKSSDSWSSCLFNSSNEWVYVSQMGPSFPVMIGDGNIFSVDSYVVLVDNYGCSVMNFITSGIFNDGIQDTSFIPCVGDVDGIQWDIGYAAGRSLAIPLEYRRNYSHIIRWDFQYK